MWTSRVIFRPRKVAASSAAYATWVDAVDALSRSSSNVDAHRRSLETVHSQPLAVAENVVRHCLIMQRYSNECVVAAFGELCDALVTVPSAGTPEDAARVLQLSMQRGGYTDAGVFGKLLRLHNARLDAKAFPEVSRMWTWMQHTRANYCAVARSAVIAATARDNQHAAAVRLETNMRLDGVLLREEGLVPLLKCLPRAEWMDAIKLVRHWSAEHTAAAAALQRKPAQSSDSGAPGRDSIMALIQVCSEAQKPRAARDILAHWLGDTDVLTSMTLDDLRVALSSVIPSCRPVASSDEEKGDSEPSPEADVLRQLLLAASIALRGVEVPSAAHSDVFDKNAELLGYMAAAAALLRNREELVAVSRTVERLGFDSRRFDLVLDTLVGSLHPTAWREAKLAVVELARHMRLDVPAATEARLHVLHKNTTHDDEAVLDAALGSRH